MTASQPAAKSPLQLPRPDFYHTGTRPDLLQMVQGSPRWALEVGCGVGNTGRALKEMHPNCRVIGIELDPVAAEQARANLDIVFCGDVERLPLDSLGLAPGTLDCIIYGDILEHLVDPWRVLDEHRQFIAPGGQVVASVPNVRHGSVLENLVGNGRWPYTAEGLLDATHLRFFTLAEMVEMFDNAGYLIRRMATNPPYQPPAHSIDLDYGKFLIRNVTPAEMVEYNVIQFLFDAVPKG